MLQNLKVDMVYYKTNTDFEMEFNLCGCCRMRLLNDKVSEPKTFVASLARAVSRSRIIITVGPIKGENSTVALVASALSANVVAADSESYGIKEDEEIFILEGSTPLVTPDGEFGGCIIESGPQSMILLSDDKNIRKKIMGSLVHPYIEELSKQKPRETCDPIAKQIKDNTLRTVEAVKEMVSGVESVAEGGEQLIIEAPVNVTDKVPQETVPEIKPVTDPIVEIFTTETEKSKETEEPKTESPRNAVEDILFTGDVEENIPFHPFSSVKPVKRWQKEVDEEDVPTNMDDDFEEIYSSRQKPKAKSKTLNTLILIFFVLLLVSIAVLCYCVFYVPAKDGVEAGAYIHDIFKILFG